MTWTEIAPNPERKRVAAYYIRRIEFRIDGPDPFSAAFPNAARIIHRRSRL